MGARPGMVLGVDEEVFGALIGVDGWYCEKKSNDNFQVNYWSLWIPP